MFDYSGNLYCSTGTRIRWLLDYEISQMDDM
uniref:Uncharacterized protein n=1 Tax=Rhizophora mucronata TaxID=61149 RepID=A0A2P2QT32_RHIMU